MPVFTPRAWDKTPHHFPTNHQHSPRALLSSWLNIYPLSPNSQKLPSFHQTQPCIGDWFLLNQRVHLPSTPHRGQPATGVGNPPVSDPADRWIWSCRPEVRGSPMADPTNPQLAAVCHWYFWVSGISCRGTTSPGALPGQSCQGGHQHSHLPHPDWERWCQGAYQHSQGMHAHPLCIATAALGAWLSTWMSISYPLHPIYLPAHACTHLPLPTCHICPYTRDDHVRPGVRLTVFNQIDDIIVQFTTFSLRYAKMISQHISNNDGIHAISSKPRDTWKCTPPSSYSCWAYSWTDLPGYPGIQWMASSATDPLGRQCLWLVPERQTLSQLW